MRRPAVIPVLAFAGVSTLASPFLSELQTLVALSPDILRLTVFSTTVGAAVVWLIWRSSLAYPQSEPNGHQWQTVFGVVAVACSGGLAFLLARYQAAPWQFASYRAVGQPISLFLLVQLLGAAAEEVGWRGLVQPLLETRMSRWAAALTTGLLFGLGHFYMAFSVTPVAMALFLVNAVALSVILATATVGRSWSARVAVATLVHFMTNLETFFLFTDGDGSVRYFAVLAVAFGLAGLVGLWLLVVNSNAETAEG